MKIYTKTGDKGKTSLYSGDRISKSNSRIEAYGNIDELNSFIGLLAEFIPKNKKEILQKIQNELFVQGSHLAAGNDHDFKLPEFNIELVEILEKGIDEMNEELPPLKHFILPGGSKGVSYTHVCRTITRRAERGVVKLSEIENVPENIIIFLNRLSDYFFVFGRYIAHIEGTEEVKWLG